MKRILYLIAIIFTFCAFSLNIRAEEIENGIEGENTIVLESVNEEEPKEVVTDGNASEDADEVVEPEHEKTLTVNEDGSYTIGLTVTGETEEVISTKKVNVIVTLDISGSMDDNGGTTVTYEATTSTSTYNTYYGLVDGEYVKLSYSNSQRRYYYTTGNSNSRIYYDGTRYKKNETTEKRLAAAQAAVNSLAESLLSNNGGNNPDDTIEISLVTFSTHAQISKQPTTSLSEFERVVNGLSANGGTNWEEALKKISTVNFNDNDETYVIFVSDGNPTFYTTDANNHDYNSQYQAYGTGKEEATNITRSYNAAVDDAKAIVDGGAKFYTIGAYGNVDRMESLTTAAGAPKSNYYSAIDTLQLQEALNAILNDIKSAGFGSAKITDGTTSNVATSTGVSHLLTVDIESFKYYKDDVEWEDAPEADLNEYGEVVWDLGSGLLDNGVTYKVTFDAWASQEALDLIADLKNGTVQYDSLDREVQKYLIKNGNTYSLATNTVATLRYVDTRELIPTKRGDNSKSVIYVNPEPEAQDVPSMEVEKKWANEIDELEKSPISIELLRDGELNATITLDNDNNYSEEVFIAPGRIHIQGNSGKYQVKETGHDYTFRETGSDVHNWELSSEIFHPMLINDVMTMLVKRDSKPEGEEITDYFIINGNYYERSSITKLVATNERRSWIDITKSVTSASTTIDENQTFNFEINVTDPNGDDIEFVVTNNNEVVTAEVSGANYDASTGRYVVTSGTAFTVSIKAGWNIRVMNLLSNSEYSISEVNIDSKYALDKVKFDGEEVESTGTVTGTIESANMTYSYEYVNKVIGTDIIVLIEWDDQDNLYNNRPENVTLNLTDGKTTFTQPAMEATRGLSWKYVYSNMPLTDEDGNAIEYTLTQDTVNGYKAATVAQSGNVFTVTNELELISLTVNKVWDDSDNDEGFRPESLTVTLNNTDYELNSRNSWSYTVDNLPTYIDGEKVEYTWTEEDVDGYTLTDTTISNGVTTFTNKHEITEVTVNVKKVWSDSDNDEGFRPDDVTVNLLADGEVIDTVTLSDDNDWSYEWTKLDGFASGEEIIYTVTEDKVENYSTRIDKEENTYNFTITNSRSVEEITISVEKVWDDEDNAEGFRTDSVMVNLIANDEVIESVKLNAGNNWSYAWTELQKYVDGEEVVYDVTEDKVDNYTTNIVKDSDTNKYTITNSREVEYIELTVRKVWDDEDDIEGFRPDSLTVKLGDQEFVLNDGNDWEATAQGLQKYVDGEEVEYTWEEEDVDEYKLTSTELVDGVITVLTNTHEVTRINISVEKVWGVPEDELADMPTVTVTLIVDGEEIGSLELSNDNGWKAKFEDLVKYANGEEIAYDIAEVEIEGYTAIITGSVEEGFTVTNYPNGTGGPTDEPIPPHTGIEENNSLLLIQLMIAVLLIGLSISKRKIYE